MPAAFGYTVAAEDAVRFVRAVLRSPIRNIDTANGYSDGESERRIGAAVAAEGGLPPDVVVMTKVDARDGDYSGRRVRASVEESRRRLGLDTLPLVHLHDPEFHDWGALTARGGAVDALVALRDSGAVGSIGVAGGHTPTMARYLALGVFDVVLVHNRWTLVDRSAGDLIADAAARGVGVVNAAVFGGGLLAGRSGATGAPTYGYRPARPETLTAVMALRALCERWGTDLATAALQHSLADPRIATTVVGASRPERLDQLLDSAAAELPTEFWSEAAALAPAPEAWLDAQQEPPAP
ncbi:aldo/keto reductase [Kineococcus sp. R8]|nr:aldo/keto reductase [Kineococcus siccus]NAZ81335.1 aldo/keto reductase [Kineococcus siccus]